METAKKQILVFKDGTEKKVTGESGKYWICGDAAYRKLNADIAEVKETNRNPANEKKKKTGKKKEDEKVRLEEGFDNIPEISDLFIEDDATVKMEE